MKPFFGQKVRSFFGQKVMYFFYQNDTSFRSGICSYYILKPSLFYFEKVPVGTYLQLILPKIHNLVIVFVMMIRFFNKERALSRVEIKKREYWLFNS